VEGVRWAHLTSESNLNPIYNVMSDLHLKVVQIFKTILHCIRRRNTGHNNYKTNLLAYNCNCLGGGIQ
jgi:hypothetical protein